MPIDLLRTFSVSNKSSMNDVEEDWSLYFDQNGAHKTWSDLHANGVSIVIGEAGIGKTTEFSLEVDRLTSRGEAAFFLPLNQLTDTDSWQLVLTGQRHTYDSWLESDQLGYFFLDAVDEARLRSHADFEKALAVVQRALEQHFSRVRIAISSRVTDWSVHAVQAAVDRRITAPLSRSLNKSEISLESDASDIAAVGLVVSPKKFEGPLIVTLDPLSLSEAKRCANAFDLQEPQRFWETVSEGDYEFMATRPLDLRWMVSLWNKRRTLGNFRELMAENIDNRLQELNESYVATGKALSVDQLRTGVRKLAAAAEFGDCAYFNLDPSVPSGTRELNPQSVLPNWEPQEVRRLLATAIFDEASYGRVKFHHRSIREYLAAEWTAEQLKMGVPLLRLQSLFVGHAFEQPAVIPARKAVLSWLAALNVTVREWVARDLPEILFSEGDPQGWDEQSAEMAFKRCIKASRIDFRPSWHHSSSTYMRVGRALPAGVIATALADITVPEHFKALCYRVAYHANLNDCTPVAMVKCRDLNAPDWQRIFALSILQKVGTYIQRKQILLDLQAGFFKTNELIAYAVRVINWKELDIASLANIFAGTHSESDYSSGAMARLFRDEIIPDTNLASATLALEAVMAAWPITKPGKRFARFTESDFPERAWLLEVLPDLLERVLTLSPSVSSDASAVCMEAAERLDALRYSGIVDTEEIKRVNTAITRHTSLRWDIALAIANSKDISTSINHLTWEDNCLVTMTLADFPELVKRANDISNTTSNTEIWQAVAINVAFHQKHGHARAHSLRALGPYTQGTPREKLINDHYRRWREGAKTNRKWATENQHRKAKAAKDLVDFKEKITANLTDISDGTNEHLLLQLLQRSFHLSSWSDYTNVDFKALSTNLSPEIAINYKHGLKKFWRAMQPPDPADYTEGRVPWIALIGLAGLRCHLIEPDTIYQLTASDITKAAQLSVWNLNGPPDWFEALAETHAAVVQAALVPWLIREAQSAETITGLKRVLEMVLNCKSVVRKGLLAPLVPVITSNYASRLNTLRGLINAMREDSLLPSTVLSVMCESTLSTHNTENHDPFWFQIWMEEDAIAAWTWFKEHIAALGNAAKIEASSFIAAISDLKWLMDPLPQAQADLLIEIYDLLVTHPDLSNSSEGDHDGFFDPPAKRISQGISTIFVRTRGAVGRNGLLELTRKTTESNELQRLRALAREHASLEAAKDATRTIEELHAIASPFISEPRTKEQLYIQVIARLEEIRKNLEEGPFSERDLFSCGMPEKHLQRWLAAKFLETQNRRFSIHREEEVDNEKITDIQLSFSKSNICIEIKPVDKTRYSASSLVNTLRTQIVGQYLKGNNSSHGILVLMQLDEKTWDIPGGRTRQPFSALVKYLEGQAAIIKLDFPDVDELRVFGMKCVS